MIVGSGISGLITAAQLLRFGIRPVVIDQRSSPEKSSDFLQISAHSLEVLNQLGIIIDEAEKFKINGLTVQRGRRVIEELQFHKAESTSYSPVQIIRQSHLEQLLIQNLTLSACPIYWNVKLTGWIKNGPYYQANLRVDNIEHQIRTEWVIGADGAFGTVRKLMNRDAPAKKQASYFNIQVQLKESINRNIHLCMSKYGNIKLTPLTGRGMYRVSGQLSRRPNEVLSDAGLVETMTRILGFKLPIQTPIHRTSEHLYDDDLLPRHEGKAILVGAAAFKNSNLVSEDCINEAIEDSHNLSWKLAYVLHGKLPTRLLNSYAEERNQTEQKNLRIQRWLGLLLTNTNNFLPFLHNLLIPAIANYIRQHPNRFNRVMAVLSHTQKNYRNSTLSVHLSSNKVIRAGDRLPNIPLYDEKYKRITELHNWCKKPGFILLVLGEASKNQLFIMAQWIQQKYAGSINFFYLPFSSRNRIIFENFQIADNGRKMIFVRPDMYIACIHDELNTNLIDTYMTEILGWKTATDTLL